MSALEIGDNDGETNFSRLSALSTLFKRGAEMFSIGEHWGEDLVSLLSILLLPAPCDPMHEVVKWLLISTLVPDACVWENKVSFESSCRNLDEEAVSFIDSFLSFIFPNAIAAAEAIEELLTSLRQSHGHAGRRGSALRYPGGIVGLDSLNRGCRYVDRFGNLLRSSIDLERS